MFMRFYAMADNELLSAAGDIITCDWCATAVSSYKALSKSGKAKALRVRIHHRSSEHDHIEPRFYWTTSWQYTCCHGRRPIESRFNLILVLNFDGEFGP